MVINKLKYNKSNIFYYIIMKLVIVESPAKCKKIESYLGPGYKCVASFGHIREFSNGLKSIDSNNNYKASYKTIPLKNKYIANLKKMIDKSTEVILATDDDREGEAIAWHICIHFRLPVDRTKRIIFHEITKKALKNAVNNYTYLDMDKVYAQQSRQILDLIVGYKLSPLLWKYISRNSKLSAGRCQSSALRLVYDNYKDLLDNNEGSKKYDTVGIFTDNKIEFKLNKHYTDTEKMEEFLIESVEFIHTFTGFKKQILVKKPPSPLITSRLQQLCSNDLGYSPKQTMRSAQILYENGYITYMRTDSMKYSEDFVKQTKDYIEVNYGKEFLRKDIDKLSENKEKKNGDNVTQDAHEAIRPTDIKRPSISVDSPITVKELRVYLVIYKNALASCMSDAKFNKITSKISAPFNAEYSNQEEEVIFPGWKEVYGYDKVNGNYRFLLKMKKGKEEKYHKITSKMAIKNLKQHYNEAKLIQLLEKKGIGRPSTYSSLISKIQDKKYVEKKDVSGVKLKCINFELIGDELEEKEETNTFGNERNKLVITPTGVLVIEFLLKYFMNIFEYDYTKMMEDKLDKISKGELIWHSLCSDCDKDLIKNINKIKENSEIKIDEHHSYMIGKYGPVIKYKNGEEIEFKSVKKDIDINKLKNGEYKLEDLIISDKNKPINNVLGQYKENDVILKKGKYGLYINYNKKNFSIKGLDKEENDITLDDVLPYLNGSKNNQNKNILKQINKDASVRTGKWGPYVFYKTETMKKPKFIKIPKGTLIEQINEIWLESKL